LYLGDDLGHPGGVEGLDLLLRLHDLEHAAALLHIQRRACSHRSSESVAGGVGGVRGRGGVREWGGFEDCKRPRGLNISTKLSSANIPEPPPKPYVLLLLLLYIVLGWDFSGPLL
jgi:hypothetical protein